jgi:hypothetical protein
MNMKLISSYILFCQALKLTVYIAEKVSRRRAGSGDDPGGLDSVRAEELSRYVGEIRAGAWEAKSSDG